MKTLRSLASIFILLLWGSCGYAVAAGPQPASWQQTSDGVSVAFELTISRIVTPGSIQLTTYIKNTSSGIKYCHWSFGERGIEVYYLDAQGQPHPLHNYTEPPPGRLFLSTPSPYRLESGKVWKVDSPLSPDDLKLLLAHTSYFECNVADDMNSKTIIKSSPVQLVAPATPPGK